MQSFFFTVAVFAALFANVLAVCPGFNYALQDRGNQNYNIFDDSCNGVQTDIYHGVNACTQGTLSCSPPPVTITGALIRGNWYACRADPNSGSCAGHFNNYCCRNDGN